MRRTFVGAMAFAVTLLVLAGSAYAITTVGTANGTWTADPGYGAATYQAAVQQPIEAGNTSNWNSKSKGAIPVMFKLSSATGPFIFESFVDSDPATYPYSFLNFSPDTPPTLAQVTQLIANYSFTVGDCHAGSLRWTLYLDDNGVTRNLDIHYQPGQDSLSGQFCKPGTSGANLADLSSTDPYVVIQEFVYAGTPYTFTSANPVYNTTYADAVGELGALSVLGMNLIVDSGFAGNERVSLASATVGVGGTTPYVQTFTPQPAGTLAPTCDLPAATIDVTRISPASTGPVNEAPVQHSLSDDGNAFRVVDCKYQYILSIPSLQGTGSYRVEIKIGGNTVGTANFDLK